MTRSASSFPYHFRLVIGPGPRVRPRALRPVGLYDPAYEHDGCGVACIARLHGGPRHDVVELSLRALNDLEHRGAAGADESTGDGAGILVQLPHDFLRSRASEFGLHADEVPEPGRVAVGTFFLSTDVDERRRQEHIVENALTYAGQEPLGWRDVPVDLDEAGRTATEAAPAFRQLLVAAGPKVADQDDFERRLFVARRVAELESQGAIAIPSCRARSRSSTRASRQTPSRAGSSLSRCGCSPTTARSTRSTATSTGCALARPRCAPSSLATTSSAACR